MDETHEVVKSVWNDHDDEVYRKDQSHYRGIGRWADDALWLGIGSSTLKKLRQTYQMIDHKEKYSLENQVALEWGPGGGANVHGLRSVVRRYYGVDVSERNLKETQRMIEAEGSINYFVPILFSGRFEEVSKSVIDPINVIISTAVFQHFPSKEYGYKVLSSMRAVCAANAYGFIQIRYQNANQKYSGIDDINQYPSRHIRATSYPIDEFWDSLQKSGFSPVGVTAIRSANNYATFHFTTR